MRGPALQNQAPTSTTHLLIEWWTLQPATLPPVSSPIHPRNQIQLRIYIKSIVLSVSWMRNKGGYEGLPIASVSIGIKCILKKKENEKKGQCTLGTRKKKLNTQQNSNKLEYLLVLG